MPRMPAYFDFEDPDEVLDAKDDRAYAILSMLAFTVGFLAIGLIVFIAVGIVIGTMPWQMASFPVVCAAIGAAVGWWAR